MVLVETAFGGRRVMDLLAGDPLPEDLLRRMHELSISQAIVDTAGATREGGRSAAVHLRIGALRQVVPESLDFYFGIVARDTVCEGAELRAGAGRCPAALRCLREMGPGAALADARGR